MFCFITFDLILLLQVEEGSEKEAEDNKEVEGEDNNEGEDVSDEE